MHSGQTVPGKPLSGAEHGRTKSQAAGGREPPRGPAGQREQLRRRRKPRQGGPADQSHLAGLPWEERPPQAGSQPCQPTPAAPGARKAEQIREQPIFTPSPTPQSIDTCPPLSTTPPPPDPNSMASPPDEESELGLKIVSIETTDMITWLNMDSLIEWEIGADGTANESGLQIAKVETAVEDQNFDKKAETSQLAQFDPPPDPRSAFKQPIYTMAALRSAVEGIGPFRCPACVELFSIKTHMENHMKVQHPEYRYHCLKCTKKYTTYHRLKTHYEGIHEGVKYSCSKCAYQSNFKDHLQEHVNTVHRGVRYQCMECGLKYSHRSGLTSHIRFVHHGLGGYKCHRCGYRTLKKKEFESHILSHAGGRPRRQSITTYVCRKCGKNCPSQQFLNCHEFWGCDSDPNQYPL